MTITPEQAQKQFEQIRIAFEHFNAKLLDLERQVTELQVQYLKNLESKWSKFEREMKRKYPL